MAIEILQVLFGKLHHLASVFLEDLESQFHFVSAALKGHVKEGSQGMHEGSQLFIGMFVLGYIQKISETQNMIYGYFCLPNLFSGQSPAFSRDAMDSPNTGDKK